MAHTGQVGLLALLIYIVLSANAREAERHRVIIVGAGVSGFTAAATLLENNVTDLLVLEASDRIGGRIHTVQFGDVPIDKGAEFVHGEKNNSVFELVSPFDFLASYEAQLPAEKHIFANTSGRGVRSVKTKELIYKAFEILVEVDNVTDGSLGDFFYPRLQEILEDEKVDANLSEAIRHLVTRLGCVYIAAETLFDQGARGYYEGLENEGDLSLKWKTRGYKTIFEILSKQFPNPSEELPVVNKTVFGKQVTRVERREGEGGVQVTCADGSTYLADHVIVTVSLGVLKKHAATMFHPALPSEKTAAIETIKFGCVGKVFMLFPNRWWPNDTNAIEPLFSNEELKKFNSTSSHGYWTSETNGFYLVMNHERMLCAWFAGQSCRTMESLTEEQVTDGMVELLQTLLGNMFDIPRPEKILRTTWVTNPYTLGSYSYRSVESDRRNLTNDDLAAPIMEGDKPVVQFAGEATNLGYVATVHGALDTGRREARRIIDYYKEHPES